MKHWIDRSSETDNVIVTSDTAIFVGSCDEEVYDDVDRQLLSQKNPIEVLGTDDLKTIPFGQIQSVDSRNTDKDVSIRYKAKKEIEDEMLFFDSVEDKQSFVAALDGLLPDHLVKREFKQSLLGAALSPALSLALSLAAIYLFVNKFRWLTIIVGGIWAAGSLYMLLSRAKEPPTVTRWTVGGRYVRKAWSGLKTTFSYVVLTAIIAVAHDTLPDTWGSQSIYDQLHFETLTPESVETLIGRGADVDYRDEAGDTPLSIALQWGEIDIAIALIEAGASLDVAVEGMTPLDYAKDYEYEKLVTFLSAYKKH